MVVAGYPRGFAIARGLKGSWSRFVGVKGSTMLAQGFVFQALRAFVVVVHGESMVSKGKMRGMGKMRLERGKD